MAVKTPTGHVRVEERAKGRRIWIVEYTLPGESRNTKLLGEAWVRPSGKTTPRGAPVWRAGHGTKPDEHYLTPAEAQAKLKELLEAPQQSKKPSVPRKARGKTFGDAIKDFLEHAEHMLGLEETTQRNYRVAAGQLKNEWPAETPLRRFTAEGIEAYQTKLLTTPVTRGQREPKPLKRKTVRNRMLVLSGILQRAHAKKWVANVTAEVTIVADPGANPDFNVLTPKQVEKVAALIALIAEDELPLMRDGKVDERSLAIMREARAMWRRSGSSGGLHRSALR